ncbi:hypothetical protein [Pseudomonas sp.]|uniref:hypothetical protein n=1 Tax=Pseudomonas sp. TaxID=306 RepID=UPI003342471E
MDIVYLVGALIGIGTPCLAGLVWLIRLEGRINTETALREALRQRLDGFEARIYEVLERIESKLDRKADKE